MERREGRKRVYRAPNDGDRCICKRRERAPGASVRITTPLACFARRAHLTLMVRASTMVLVATIAAASVFASSLRGVQNRSAGSSSDVCAAPTDSVPMAVWAGVRGALQSADSTAKSGDLRYTVRLHRRLLTRTARVVDETDSVVTDLRTLPISSARPEQLLDSGFVVREPSGEWSYYSPVPETLLNDRFLDLYCVWQQPAASGSHGLEFAPRHDVARAALAGTIHVDNESRALESLEFRFLNDPTGLRDSLIGGRISFAQVASGPWVPNAWKIRTPILVADHDSASELTRYVGLEEVGASAIEITHAASNLTWSDQDVTVLSGSVHDSLTDLPLVGALVALSGTRHWATTDERGEFFIAGELDGIYDLVFGHPKLDSIGFVSTPLTLELPSGAARNVSLAVPSLPKILANRCGGQPPAGGRRTLIGVVHDSESGRAVPGVLVTVSRAIVPEGLRGFTTDRVENTVRTDSLGMYSLCDVPVGQAIVVNGVIDTRSTPFTDVTFNQRSVQIGDRELHALRYPVARLDLDLVPAASHRANLSGVVVDDATGKALDGVDVRIDGTFSTKQTDEGGRFEFTGVPEGPVWLAFRKLGFRMLRRSVSVEPHERIVIARDSLRMKRASTDAITLDPIVVEAERGVPTATGFEDRRNRGFGSFLTREEFEDWNPSVPTDLLRRMRGVRVLPNPLYGFAGDTRKYQIVPSRDIGQRVTRIDPSRTDLASGLQAAAVTECPVLLFLDGVYLGDSQTTDVDNMIGMSALAAIEFYSPSQVPPRFALPGSTCGVAIFWSR